MEGDVRMRCHVWRIACAIIHARDDALCNDHVAQQYIHSGLCNAITTVSLMPAIVWVGVNGRFVLMHSLLLGVRYCFGILWYVSRDG